MNWKDQVEVLRHKMESKGAGFTNCYVLTPEAVTNATNKIDVPLLASIPCYCEVAIHASSSAFINSNEKHPFVQNMKDLFERVKGF